MSSVKLSDIALSIVNKTTSSNSSKKVDSLTKFLTSSPLKKLGDKASGKVDKVIHSKLLSEVGDIFLSSTDEYLAAMLAMAQENIENEIASIQSEIDDIKNTLVSYVETLKRETDRVIEARTFPNFIRLLADMQVDMGIVLTDVGSLQGRLYRKGEVSDKRMTAILTRVNGILEKNSEIEKALGIYDPDAEVTVDIESLANYLEGRVNALIDKVKKAGNFKMKFQVDIDPLDVFYKNFYQLYTYLCDASKRITKNATEWKSSNINTLRENISIIKEDLYRSLVILDKYKNTRRQTGTSEEHVESVVERAVREFSERLVAKNMGPIMDILAELLYIIKAVKTQGIKLFTAPFVSFKDEVLKKGIPDNVLSLLNFDAIRNGEWSKVIDFDEFMKSDLKSIAMEKLLEKGEDIGIPVDKLPKIEALTALGSRMENKFRDLKDSLTDLKNTVSPPDATPLKELPSKNVKEAVMDMSALSPSMSKGFKEADVSKISGALASPEGTTSEGAAAASLKSSLKDLESDPGSDITVNEKDAINRAISLLSADHIQQCTDALLKAEGFSDKLTFEIIIDEYVTEVYDNVNTIVDWLSQLSDATEDNVPVNSSQSLNFELKMDVLTQKGS